MSERASLGVARHDERVARAKSYASSAIRDALREAIRTVHRRRLNDDERDLFLTMIDELDVRGKAGHRG